MKINPPGIKAYEAYIKRAGNNNTPVSARANRADQNDRLELSREARQLARYRQELQNIPDVRSDLVDSLKARIKAGNYEISPEKIARGIIKENFLDKKV